MNKTFLVERVLEILESKKSVTFQSTGSFKRILVLRNNHIGDAVMVTPVIRDIRKYYPDAFIAAAAGSWACDVFNGNPALNGVIELNTPWGNKKVTGAGSLSKILYFFLTGKEIKKISDLKFDLAIDFSGHPLNRLFLRCAGVPCVIAMTTASDDLPLAWKTFFHGREESMGKSFLKSIETLGFPPGDLTPELYITEDDRIGALEKIREAGFSGAEFFLVVAPGAGWPESKCWLPERFAEVAGRIFREKSICSVIAGSPEEARLTSQVVKRAGPGVFDLGGKLNLKEYFAAVSMASLVVCNNSSALHIARAFNKPAVVICSGLYGGREAQEKSWGYPHGSYFLGGAKTDCDLTCAKACVSRECMRQVGVDEVYNRIRQLLEGL